MSVLGARPSREARARTGERPAHVSLRVERDELVCARPGDEKAVRREGGVLVAPEVALRPVRPHEPEAAAACHQQLPGRGDGKERRFARPPPDGLAQGVDDRLRPGGLTTAATTAATSAPATSGRTCRRGQATGSRVS